MINKSNKKGFTLLETLVAVMILSLAIAGPLSIAQQGLEAAITAKDQDVAFYLAQDAVEYIRYARDTNCLAAGSVAGGCPAAQWLAGNSNTAQTINLTPCVSTTGTSACTIDVTVINSQPAACASGICPALNYDSTKNYYTYASGSASIFTRTVTITSPVGTCPGALCNQSEAAVSVKVAWFDPVAHSITVKESLFDWQ